MAHKRAKQCNGRYKPWFTNGLRNACKKKNCLYKTFLLKRTVITELKYKQIKNKLTSIIRKCEKEYYMKVLEQEKHNIKGTWKILNSIIRKGQKSTSFPDSFENNGATLKNKMDIANGFNDFFVKVGPKLAEKIEEPNGNIHVDPYQGRINCISMLLNDIEEILILLENVNIRNLQAMTI